MKHNQIYLRMKKNILMLIVMIGFGIIASAQNTTDSCVIRGIPGAYVTVEASPSRVSDRQTTIHVEAFGVERNGAVQVRVTYFPNSIAVQNQQTQTIERLVNFSRDRNGRFTGSVNIPVITGLIVRTEAFNAVCH